MYTASFVIYTLYITKIFIGNYILLPLQKACQFTWPPTCKISWTFHFDFLCILNNLPWRQRKRNLVVVQTRDCHVSQKKKTRDCLWFIAICTGGLVPSQPFLNYIATFELRERLFLNILSIKKGEKDWKDIYIYIYIYI